MKKTFLKSFAKISPLPSFPSPVEKTITCSLYFAWDDGLNVLTTIRIYLTLGLSLFCVSKIVTIPKLEKKPRGLSVPTLPNQPRLSPMLRFYGGEAKHPFSAGFYSRRR